MADSKLTRAEKARRIAERYSGDGQSFHVKYLGTQEVSSAKGDAVIADCLKELRTLFREVASHLPKVVVTLQLTGITVTDEKSKLQTVKVPLNQVSYVCLDPGDNSVFSFIIRSQDTISSKSLRLHAFVCHPQTAITFNRSARELFDFMVRVMRAKKKLAQQEATEFQPADTSVQPTLEPVDTPVKSLGISHDVTVPALPPPVTYRQPQPPVPLDASSTSTVSTTGPVYEEKRQQTVFDEWKELERELNSIEQDLDIGVAIEQPITSTPNSSPPTNSAVESPVNTLSAATQSQPTPLNVMTASGSDAFGSSFFDLSFGSGQPLTAPAMAVGSPGRVDSYRLFNGHAERTEPTTEPSSSTPRLRQRTYSSRPRPKGKVLDGLTVFSPPPSSDTSKSSSQRAIRDVSLSPTREQKVKSILSNTDPFTPPSLDASQTPPSRFRFDTFQPAPSTQSTPNSNFFSPSSVTSQDSIQLINPLYQSYSLDGSPSVPFSFPPQPMRQHQQPAMMMPALGYPMQLQFPGAVPQAVMMPQIQPAPLLLQSQVPPGPQVPVMGVNSFDGALSLTDGSSWPAQSPPAMNTSLNEQRDHMFADLLPSGPHTIPEKKKEFEPQKAAPPTLAQLQEKKKNKQEVAFRDTTDQTQEEATNWPPSPFDALSPTQPTGSLQKDESPSAVRDTTDGAQTETTDWLPSPFDALSPTQPIGSLQSPSAVRDGTQAETTDWPPSPFDALSPAQPTGIFQEPQLNASPSATLLPGDQQSPSGQSTGQQTNRVTQVIPLEDFDAAFQEASNKVNDIKSAFEVKITAQPHPLHGPATNDPFVVNGTAASPELRKPTPWDTF